MSRKKAPKAKQQWQPLPENATTMQGLVVAEIDENTIRFEDMSDEDLTLCGKVIEQSNKTLELENFVIEKYLSRMDPQSLEKMEKILEAAAIAMQKAEKTGFIAGSPNPNLQKEATVSRITDGSHSSSSRTGTLKSSVSPSPKMGGGMLGIMGGPKMQVSQKIEIVNREIDEMKMVLENFKKKAKSFNHALKCRNEEMSERLRELKVMQNDFEQKLLTQGLDPITGKLPGEKFLRYLQMILKTDEIEIDRMRIKNGSLKTHLNKLRQQLSQKEEMEVLHTVDFEILQIENKECQERLEERVTHVNDIKKVNGRFGTLLNAHKKKLQEQTNKLMDLTENQVVKEKMIKRLKEDEEKITSEVAVVKKSVQKIISLMKTYTVPDLMSYIEKKAELHDLRKEIKVYERQMKLRELAWASQFRKMRSGHELSRTQASEMNRSSISKDFNV